MALFFYKEKNKDIRAAAYLRLSIEDGDKAESNSIGNQRELIRDFAAERPGLHLIEEYADDGYTGTNFERPGFKRMMEDIKSGKINCIIVKDLSRLGRNYIEMGKYLEQIFPMMGIRFIAINDNYDNANTESSDSDSIVVPFKNLLNDSYCRDISIKVRSQLDMKRRKGEFIGGYAIYGYCKDKRNKNRLVVDEYVEHLPWIEDFKSYQNLTSLNRRVLVELVESITVYDKEHIHIQYRFDQEIRNVLEYCSSVPAAETEESAV